MTADFSDLSTPALYLALDPKYVLLAPSTGQTVSLGLIAESETGEPLSLTLGLNLAAATETAEAVTVQEGQVVVIGLAAEAETAEPVALTLAIGLATEAETAEPVSLTIGLNLATETETAEPVTPHIVIIVSLGLAAESERAQPAIARVNPTEAWRLELIERDGTPVTTLHSTDTASAAPVTAFDFQDPLADIGRGTIEAPITATLCDELVEDRIVHLALRGRRVASFLVMHQDDDLVSPQEEAGERCKTHLQTLVGVLAEGVIGPPLGSDVDPGVPDRAFDWTIPSPQFDDSGWGAASQLVRQDASTGGLAGFPDNQWNDNTAYWLWASGYTETTADVGVCYFRRTLTFATSGYYRLEGAGSFYGAFWFDSALQFETHAGGDHRVIKVTAGDHQLACVGQVTGETSNPPDTPGGVIWSIAPCDENGNITGAVVFNSDTSTLILPYQSQPPGLTTTRIVRLALEECQARGFLTDVTLSCLDTHDSAGTPVPASYALYTKSDTNLETFFLKELGETYADFACRYVDGVGIVLDVFVKDGRGQDSGVTYTRGVNIAELRSEGAPTTATALDCAWNNNGTLGYHRVTGTPAAGHPAKERALSVGAQRNLTEVDRIADGQIATFGRLRRKLTLVPAVTQDTVDGEYPGLAYWVGDTVTLPYNRALDSAPVRVIAMSGQLNRDTGQIDLVPELGDLILPAPVRAGQAIRKMGPQALGGQSRVASVVTV